ncbi:MAG: DUF3603 family protein [Bacilli bacterium]|nr:DUF3603 family protein [Bacilli bacterium]
MTYIYDVILNYTDNPRIIEFFEWNKTDKEEHIKKIPIIKVSTKQLYEIINYNIKIDKLFLDKIKNQTIMYKTNRKIEYSCLLTDSNKVIAIEINKNGTVISKSSLLLDEEEEILEESYDTKEEIINYTIKSKIVYNDYLTRKELLQQRYLLKEIDYLYKEKKYDKLSYLYEEIFAKDKLSIKEKYQRLKTDIKENYSNIHNELFEIVRLTYIKK